MLLLSFSYPQGSQTIVGDVLFDASLTEQHIVSAQVTDHQVETGAAVTDHIRPMPRKFTAEALVSNTPIVTPLTQSRGVRGAVRKVSAQAGGRQVDYQALVFDGPIDRVRDIFGTLVDAALAGALFTITGALVTYENFAIEQFTVPRSAGMSNELRCSISFRELRFISAQTVQGLPEKHRVAKKLEHKGEKPPQEAPEDTRTAAKKLFDWGSKNAGDLAKKVGL